MTSETHVREGKSEVEERWKSEIERARWRRG